MKIENFSKKLKLNKKTIASLNTGEMSVANGGICTIRSGCPVPFTAPPWNTCSSDEYGGCCLIP